MYITLLMNHDFNQYTVSFLLLLLDIAAFLSYAKLHLEHERTICTACLR